MCRRRTAGSPIIPVWSSPIIPVSTLTTDDLQLSTHYLDPGSPASEPASWELFETRGIFHAGCRIQQHDSIVRIHVPALNQPP